MSRTEPGLALERHPATYTGRLDTIVVAMPTSVALAGTIIALVFGEQRTALLLALLATVCVTAIIYPRPYRQIAFVGIFLLPFVTVLTVFRGDLNNWALYFAVLLLAIVGLGVFQRRPIPATLGGLYLAYIVVAAFVEMWLRDDRSRLPMISSLVLAFGMYALIRRADERERRLVIGAFLAFAVAEAAVGALQSWSGWPTFPIVLDVLTESPRNYFSYLLTGTASVVRQGSGTFHHFNGLGSVLALALPVAFGWWLQRVASLPRAIVPAVITVGLVTTYSRGALAGAVVGCLLVLGFERRHSRRVLGLLLACAATVVLLLVLNTVSQYYETTQNVTARVNTWEVAVDSAKKAPSNLIFGFGYGYFEESVLSTGDFITSRRSDTMAGVHSGPLQLLLEFGVVGAILFCLWLLSAFRLGLGPGHSWLSVACLGGVLAFLTHQSLDAWLFEYPGVLMVVLLALCEAECDPAQGPAMAPASAENETGTTPPRGLVHSARLRGGSTTQP